MQVPAPTRHSARQRRIPPGRRGAALLLASALLPLGALAGAPAVPAGTGLSTLALRQLAATCASCHGTDGRPADAAMPPLAGLPPDVFTAQMRAFRSGERPATVMHQISRGYTDAQVEALGAYFAGLPR